MAEDKKEELGENPFKIEEGESVEHVHRNSALHIHLKEAMLKLPIVKTKFIFIPAKMIEKQHSAVAMVKRIKDEIQELPGLDKAEYTSRTIKGMNGEYLGTRIYRIH